MAILKNRLTREYTTVPNWIINYNQLSDGAYRLLTYLYSKPDDWKVNQANIAWDLGVGLTTIKNRINELKKLGMIDVIRVGSGYEYHLKVEQSGSQNIGGHDIGGRNIDLHTNTNTTKTNNNKTEKKKIKKKKSQSEKIEVLDKRYFNNPKIDVAFNEFLEMRKEMRKPATPIAIQRTIKKLENYDDDTKLKAINKSIECNYLGIFPESINSQKDKHLEKMKMLEEA